MENFPVLWSLLNIIISVYMNAYPVIAVKQKSRRDLKSIVVFLLLF